MADTLSKLGKPVGSNGPKTRVGRGVGSGLGKTSGRGQKGQYARSRGFKPHFEGGQTPIQRRLPKRGFRNPFSKVTAAVNVGDLEIFASGSNIDEAELAAHGLIKGRYDRVKVLGEGEITKAMTVRAHAFSKAAAEKIRNAGGTVVLLGAQSA
jgi:large subunit ribosomal protein L15